MTDLPTDSPTHAHTCQPLAPSTDNKPHSATRTEIAEVMEGTNRTQLLTERMTDHNFRNFTQELVGCEDGGAPHINGIRKDRHG